MPISATEDVVTFGTRAEKTVSSSGVLQLILPTITGISPMDAKFGDEITVQGENLDLATAVIFLVDQKSPSTMQLQMLQRWTYPSVQ
ncbi:MAG: hypothetical protein R2825_06530 [Saprospiraceae bacterium]